VEGRKSNPFEQSITIMDEIARDEVYCHLTARRAVARAALHLGIDTMSQEALDTTGDVLLAYLERIGKILAVSVEASGRSSAHCHALDCIRAVEACTEAAVQRIHVNSRPHSGDDVAHTNTAKSPTEQLSWKGLAEFCFGPDWHLSDQQRQGSRGQGGAGGKVGPSATGNDTSTNRGWNAPFPDEIPDFPLASATTANPHTLSSSVSKGFHRPDLSDNDGSPMIRPKDDIPDSVFTGRWGSLDEPITFAADTSMNSKKRKIRDDELDPEGSLKKAKDNQGQGRLRDTFSSEDSGTPLYIPSFFPPFPQSASGASRIVVDTEAAPHQPLPAIEAASPPAPTEPLTNVRSALIQLGRHQYWGSGWDETLRNVGDLAVPSGPAEAGTASQPIVPLGRASGSRVARILEGSMEPMVPIG
jgi:hypothetical protein